MSTRRVSVERTIGSFTYECEYEGTLEIEGVRFDWKLEFTTPISLLYDEVILSEGVAREICVDATRRLIQITINRDGTVIELTDDEYIFFFGLLVEFTVDFYSEERTPATTARFLTKALASGKFEEVRPASVTTSTERYLTSKECEMLSTRRFGCCLTA